MLNTIGAGRLMCVVRQEHDSNNMKRLFSSPHSAEIGLIRSRLEAAGIECEMRNEYLSPAIPGTPFDPELWVLRDSQFAEASGLVAAWRAASSSGQESD
jgi:hypothetical protein